MKFDNNDFLKLAEGKTAFNRQWTIRRNCRACNPKTARGIQRRTRRIASQAGESDKSEYTIKHYIIQLTNRSKIRKKNILLTIQCMLYIVNWEFPETLKKGKRSSSDFGK